MDNQSLILGTFELQGKIKALENEVAQVNMQASDRHAKEAKIIAEIKKADADSQKALDALVAKLTPLKDALKTNLSELEKNGVSPRFFGVSSVSSISM